MQKVSKELLGLAGYSTEVRSRLSEGAKDVPGGSLRDLQVSPPPTPTPHPHPPTLFLHPTPIPYL